MCVCVVYIMYMCIVYVYGIYVWCVCVYRCVSLPTILILSLAALVTAPKAMDLQGRCTTNEQYLYLKLFFFNQENSTSISKTYLCINYLNFV